MIIISHRGNISGPIPELENTTSYIDAALDKSFLCEVDVWRINEELYLSHDYPKNISPTNYDYFFLRKHLLIIHCKNMEAFCFFNSQKSDGEKFHYFWHQNDDFTLTSEGWIWTYPKKPILKQSGISICVFPEFGNESLKNFSGICSDFVATSSFN